MDLSIAGVLALVRLSIRDPRSAARYLLALRQPGTIGWMLFGLVTFCSAVLTHLSFALLPDGPEKVIFAPAVSLPLLTAAGQAMVLGLVTAATYGIGRWRGGTGSFNGAILLISWLQVVLLWVQIVQILALLVSPSIAEIVGLFSIGLSFWLLTHFITELHGFRSSWNVFFGILASIFALAVVASVLIKTLYGAGV